MLTFHEKFLPNIFIGNITLHSVYSVIVPPPALKSFNTLNWRLNFYNWSQWVECWTLHKLVQLLKLMPPPSPSPAKLKTAPWLIKYFLSFHRSYFLYGICHPPNEFHSIARGLFWFNVNISLIWIKWYILAPSWCLLLHTFHISHPVSVPGRRSDGTVPVQRDFTKFHIAQRRPSPCRMSLLTFSQKRIYIFNTLS